MSGKLTFSDYSSDYVNNNKSTFRKAGDIFNVGSGTTMNNSTVGNSSSKTKSAYDNWMSAMGNMSSSSNNSNRPNSSIVSNNKVEEADEVGKDSIPNPTTAGDYVDGDLNKSGMSNEEVAAAPAPKEKASKSNRHSGSRATYYATTPGYGQKDNTINNLMMSQYRKWLDAGNVSTDPNAPKF